MVDDDGNVATAEYCAWPCNTAADCPHQPLKCFSCEMLAVGRFCVPQFDDVSACNQLYGDNPNEDGFWLQPAAL